jgi:putative transposase
VRSWKDQRRPLREGQPNSRTSLSSDSTNAFEWVMAEAMDLRPTRLPAYCPMPNHWHMRPRVEGELSAFVDWLSLTHATRYRTQFANKKFGRCRAGAQSTCCARAWEVSVRRLKC